MKTLDPDEEEQLLGDVKRAFALVDGEGLAPDDAILKIARERGYGAGHVRLIGCTYNTGRQTAQREAGESCLDKLAAFPLADPEGVIGRLYGPVKAAAAPDPDYDRPPTWLDAPPPGRVKAASRPAPAPPPAPAPTVSRAYAAIDRAKAAAAEAARGRSEREDRLRAKVASVVAYFRSTAPSGRLPFPVVAQAASAYFGPRAGPFLDLVHGQARVADLFGEKRAGDRAAVLVAPLDLDAPPFPAIRDCLKLAAEVVSARAAEKAAAALVASTREDQLRPFSPAGVAPRAPETAPVYDFSGEEKAAGVFATPAIGAMVGTMISRGIGNVPKTKDDLIEDAWLDLEDPQHQNELRKIRAHAMLNDLFTDPESPIAGYDPDRVLHAYNEMAQLSPRSSEQSAVMGPLLKRRLAGGFEPFESQEVANIEKSLAGNKAHTPNTGKLHDAPDALHG